MNWKEKIGQIAPELGRALGGPLGGYVTSFVCEQLGLSPSSTDDEIDQHFLNNPDAILKSKQIEADLKIKLSEHGIQSEKIHADDRNSARQREIGVKGWSNPILATVIIGGFFVTVLYVLTGKVQMSGENIAMIGMLVGYVSAKADQVVSYYFGSSAGSDKKNEIIAMAQQQKR